MRSAKTPPGWHRDKQGNLVRDHELGRERPADIAPLAGALGALCLVLAFIAGALGVNAAQDCSGSSLELGVPAAGVLVTVSVFLLARSPWWRFLGGVVAGIAVFLIFLLAAIAVGVSNCI